jgi:hypothetical protein
MGNEAHAPIKDLTMTNRICIVTKEQLAAIERTKQEKETK